MLGIQAELTQRPADFFRRRVVLGSPRRAVAAAGVHKLQRTPILEIENSTGKRGVRNIAADFTLGEIGKHRAIPTVTNSPVDSQYI